MRFLVFVANKPEFQLVFAQQAFLEAKETLANVMNIAKNANREEALQKAFFLFVFPCIYFQWLESNAAKFSDLQVIIHECLSRKYEQTAFVLAAILYGKDKSTENSFTAVLKQLSPDSLAKATDAIPADLATSVPIGDLLNKQGFKSEAHKVSNKKNSKSY